MTAAELLARDFATLPDLIRAHAAEQGAKISLVPDERAIDYAALDALIDRVAAALQRDGAALGQPGAIAAASRVEYAVVLLGMLGAGCVAAPLASSAPPASLAANAIGKVLKHDLRGRLTETAA